MILLFQNYIGAGLKIKRFLPLGLYQGYTRIFNVVRCTTRLSQQKIFKVLVYEGHLIILDCHSMILKTLPHRYKYSQSGLPIHHWKNV